MSVQDWHTHAEQITGTTSSPTLYVVPDLASTIERAPTARAVEFADDLDFDLAAELATLTRVLLGSAGRPVGRIGQVEAVEGPGQIEQPAPRTRTTSLLAELAFLDG